VTPLTAQTPLEAEYRNLNFKIIESQSPSLRVGNGSVGPGNGLGLKTCIHFPQKQKIVCRFFFDIDLLIRKIC
jgi:hypothetical protein